MARLNTRPSSRYDSETPAADGPSDQENHDPVAPRMDKGKARAINPTSTRRDIPTPPSDGESSEGGESRGQKRKRDEAGTGQARDRVVGDEGSEEARFNRYYDPDQLPEDRRDVKRKSRALEREFHETRDELIRESGRALTKLVDRAGSIFETVKQTNDATLDARLLVNVSDLAYKKTNQLVLGDNSTGVDVDEFLAKCLSYMRNGGPSERDEGEPVSTNNRRARNRDESDDEDDDGAANAILDWELLGRHACFPYNARPCVPAFLLGPLSVEKKQRSRTQRRARQSKDTAGREARPEALSAADLHHSDETGLTAVCKRINTHLNKHVQRAEAALGQAGFHSVNDLHTQRGQSMLKRHRITDTGGPSLFDFVLNPRSFGQTVENLFYVSFLIKEGSFGIQNDSQGLPTIVPSEPSTLEAQRRNKTSKHQAVFSLDYATWEKLIAAYEINEPLIEHRREDETAAPIGQRGWYT